MEEAANCSLIEAPPIYRNVMHFFPIASVPVHVIAAIAVLLNEPDALHSNRGFLIVQGALNVICEIYTSFFVLPVASLPYPLLQTTGWLSQLGFRGLTQFYGMTALTGLAMGLLLEMFYYRFTQCCLFYSPPPLTMVFKGAVWMYRLIIFIIHPLVAIVTFGYISNMQTEATQLLLKGKQDLPNEILCSSVVIALFNNWVFWIVVAIHILQILLAVTGSVGFGIYITSVVCEGFALSASAKRVQKKIVRTLFVQGSIRGLLMLSPFLVLTFLILLRSSANDIANFLFVCFAYHGFPATCVMIVFTRRMRQAICFCTNARKQARVGSVDPNPPIELSSRPGSVIDGFNSPGDEPATPNPNGNPGQPQKMMVKVSSTA